MLDEKNINLVLKDEAADEKPLLTLRGLAQQTKRLFVLWLVCSLVVALIAGGFSYLSAKQITKVNAAVEFTFSGIEDGKDPAGNEFDVATQMKSPVVLKNALDAMGISLEDVSIDDLRGAIKLQGIVPEDAMDELTAYKSVFDVGNTNALSAVQSMLNVTYHPSRYIITFLPSEAGLSAADGVGMLDAILTAYKQYFYETYGYNKALGTAVLAIDYHDYDYERAIDVFDTSLESAQRYVNTLANEDTTGFRSVNTGYTFTDLANALGTLRNEDLDWIASYVTINNVTKDKETLLTYYAYRIENLTLAKTEAESNLVSIQESINSYEKDSVVVVGGDQYGKDLNLSQSSEQYDKMINRKLAAQETISECTKNIAYYEQRVAELRMSTSSATGSQMKELDAQMDKLYAKITTLLETVDATADEFYENVAFQNAYSVVVPPVSSTSGAVRDIISKILVPEVALFVVFAIIVVVRAFVAQYRLNNPMPAAVVAETADDAAKAEEETERKNDKKKA